MKYWSGVKFWSGKSACSLLIKSCILWIGVLELSGVRFLRGKSRKERSCDVCVCGQALCNHVIVMAQ